MRHILHGSFLKFFALVGLMVLAFAPTAFAQQTQSSHYQLNEVFFGSGGQLEACSTGQYCAKQSAGELTVGNIKGTNYQAQAGFNTNRTPWIEVSVPKSAVDLGVISQTSTGHDYATFTVKSYLSSGYIVQIVGAAPTYGSHQITPLASPTASTQGTEQFGMNLRANTVPASFGADPSQRPDSTFSFGTYTAGYGTVNSYKYVNGDTIARSTSSSGYTDYTIAYIMNVSGITPGGTYTTNQAIVATATF